MKRILLFTATAMLAVSAAPAKELKWADGPDGPPKGSQVAVVSGDPAKAGPFVIQLKFPADYAVPPHSHPTAEVVKVVSGSLHYGMSDKMDLAQAKTLESGQSVTMDAKMNHWAHASAPATVQVSSTGPFQITYVDPNDDPRKK